MLSFRDPNSFHVINGSIIFVMCLQSIFGVIQLVDHGGERMEKVCLLGTASSQKRHITCAHVHWQELVTHLLLCKETL